MSKQLQCCHACCDRLADFELYSDDPRLSIGACDIHLAELIDDKVNTVWRLAMHTAEEPDVLRIS